MLLLRGRKKQKAKHECNPLPTFKFAEQTLNFNFPYTSFRLQDQAQRQLKKGGKFEDLSAGECRPSALVERYDNLYTQTRLDAMDELDEVESLDKLDENGDIKNKILFSVIVVSATNVPLLLKMQ